MTISERLALCLFYVGEVVFQLGDAAKAGANYQEAKKILQRVIGARPTDLQLRQDLARVLRGIGEAQRTVGDLHGALLTLHESAGMLFRLQFVDSGRNTDVKMLALHASVEMERAQIFLELGRSAEGLDHYRKCLSAFEQIRALDPSNARSQRAVAIIQAQVGGSLVTLGDVDTAISCYEVAIPIMQNLVSGDPVNTKTRHVLGACYERLGDALAAKGKYLDALGNFREAQSIFRAPCGSGSQ